MSKCCFYIHIMASLGASNHVPQKPQQKFIRSSRERDLKIASALKRTLSDSITFSDLSTDRPTYDRHGHIRHGDQNESHSGLTNRQKLHSRPRFPGRRVVSDYQNSCPCIPIQSEPGYILLVALFCHKTCTSL